MLLGCIADDFTGATDLANNLVRGGMRVVQTIGVPEKPLSDEVDAVVVALKSRTIPARDAVAQSLAALAWLKQGGCRQVYFKYCSTFDSTPAGNIGPVTEALKADGVKIAIVDALSNEDLMRLGRALDGMTLVTAGSGVAIGLPQNYAGAGQLRAEGAATLPAVSGYRAIMSGSCSLATNIQVLDYISNNWQAYALDPLRLAAGEPEVARALEWARPLLTQGPVLIYTTAEPGKVQAVQQRLGANDAGRLVEAALASVARGLVDAGVRQLIVAGGETSGAVVQALGIEALRIGAQIDPGVPWTASIGSAPLWLALKSGNFGAPDFFRKAFRQGVGR